MGRSSRHLVLNSDTEEDSVQESVASMRIEQNIWEVLQKIKLKKKRKEVQKGDTAEEEE